MSFLVTPNMHRQNSSEQVIQTSKNYYIPGLSTIDTGFHIREWDRLLFRCTIILNILHNARFNPVLSAYTYLNVPYNFK